MVSALVAQLFISIPIHTVPSFGLACSFEIVDGELDVLALFDT